MEETKMKRIIGFDTETTGLPVPRNAPLQYQPYITDICILIFNNKMQPLGDFETLIKIPIPVPAFITKITGIDDHMLEKEKAFKHYAKKIKKIIETSNECFGQNISFDLRMVEIELARLNMKLKRPPKITCTVEQSRHLKGIRLKNNELYESVTGKIFENAHRARPDIEGTTIVYKELKKCGLI